MFQTFKKIIKTLPKNIDNKTIAILGLTFKPNTDDSRGSFLIRLLKDLLERPLYKDQRKIFMKVRQ